jgi:regulator of sigma E protease
MFHNALDLVTNLLSLILVLSVLVVVHEFGHFAVAKFFKFPVEVFSIGFGKRLFGRKVNGTDYRVSAIPLGGYVRVIGLGPDESTLAEGTSTEAPPAVGKRWQRALILVAGPLMNFVLALVLYTSVFVFGLRVPAYQLQPAVIVNVVPKTRAEAAGFKAGDRIVSVDGEETPRWRDVEYMFALNAREKLKVEVDRGGIGKFLEIEPRPVGKNDEGFVDLDPIGNTVRPRLETVTSGGPAAQANLKAGDVIDTVAGKPVRGGPTEPFNQFVAAINGAAPGPFPITFLRDGKAMTTMVKPRRDGDTWKIDVSIGGDLNDLPQVLERFPLKQSFVEAWRRMRTDLRATVMVLGRLFRGRASMKTMSGPIDIAKFAGGAARTGPVPLVALMAAISLQLGIFNLLPIPVLDGGHLFLLTLEGVARRDFSLRVKERILQFGFVMILVLVCVILYNDLAKNLPGKIWPF